MVSPAHEGELDVGEATPLPSEESDSGETYEALKEDATVSQGDIEIAVRVAHAAEAIPSDSTSPEALT